MVHNHADRSAAERYERSGVRSPAIRTGPPRNASRTKLPTAKFASSGRRGPTNAKQRAMVGVKPALADTAHSASAARLASPAACAGFVEFGAPPYSSETCDSEGGCTPYTAPELVRRNRLV